ncbi:hypothetical protein BV898_01517 [Hypsibius exemplaris]|uniref:TATA-box-binding protein n=1 Tax=Hypsibius exemplaris TaxID=2072580 RepID=A0A1W0XAC8_HYPEX|nr:hypothetical protein BV898_01517 [Hypsibius exemplaris]
MAHRHRRGNKRPVPRSSSPPLKRMTRSETHKAVSVSRGNSVNTESEALSEVPPVPQESQGRRTRGGVQQVVSPVLSESGKRLLPNSRKRKALTLYVESSLKAPTTTPSVPTDKYFSQQLLSLPQTKEGLPVICSFICDRLNQVKRDFGICAKNLNGTHSDGRGPTDVVAAIGRLKTFGRFGTAVSPHVAKTWYLHQNRLAENDKHLRRCGDFSGGDSSGRNLSGDQYSLESSRGAGSDLSDSDLSGIKHLTDREIRRFRREARKYIVERMDVPETEISTLSPLSETKLKIQFVNSMGTCSVNCPLDLLDLYCRIRQVNYDPMLINTAVLRLPESNCSVNLTINGQLIIMGASSTKASRQIAQHALYLLKKCGYPVPTEPANFRMVNITAVVDVGYNIDIKGLAAAFPNVVYFDSDTFPAAYILPHKTERIQQIEKTEKNPNGVYRGSWGMMFLVFSTGKIVLTGGTSERQLLKEFTATLYMLQPFVYGWV